MNIKCGIIGVPNIGKSTLFNFITNSKIKNENYPFCTILPNHKNIEIKNKKTINISKISKSKKITFSKIEYIDIAGLIKGASKGLGLGNTFLNNIRNTNIIIQVIRIFKDKNIININKKIDPINEINIIEDELILSDIEILEKTRKKNIKYKNIINKYIKCLEEKKIFNKNLINKNEKNFFKKINLLTFKKKIYFLNIDNYDKDKKNIKKIKKFIKKKKHKIIYKNIKKIYNEKNKNIKKKIINKIQKKIIKSLNLITFFTTNKKETKSFILKKNKNILYAAKLIHSDFKNKFIRSIVINYKKFIKYKGWNKLKKKGKIKIVGKNYIIKNNDIIHILINN